VNGQSIPERGPRERVPSRDDVRARLIDLLVEADVTALDAPYVVICMRPDGDLPSVQGPYADGVAALADLVLLQAAGVGEPGAYFTIVELSPPGTEHS
jgi:hypothetical protein